jgi:chromosome segregation ATPase
MYWEEGACSVIDNDLIAFYYKEKLKEKSNREQFSGKITKAININVEISITDEDICNWIKNCDNPDILEEIAKLEEEMKTKFITAFNAVNENFDVVFKELFGGGHAELLLDNPDDLLNCGIEIKAAPPGKVIKSLMLLSGGEQAFVAIALLFAILKVNPTPFCIFDEIEAALDEVNVTRFGQYIKRYSKQTQFIVITHRRGTMEIADKLYGVTMPDKGISKVLTMDVNDVGKDKILETNNPK